MDTDLTQARVAAAAARRGAITQRGNRPSQRWSTGDLAARATRVPPPAPARAVLTLRDSTADTSTVHFTGLASAYESPYDMWDAFGPYVEIVTAGAGSKTLARTGLDVPLVLSHDSLRRIARTTNGSLALTETDTGLEVDAPSLDLDDADVAYIVPKIRAGLITEMSFAFRIDRGVWSPDFTQYRVEEYDIHRGDVSLVGYGANPATTTNVRHQRLTGRDLVHDSDLAWYPFV